MARRAIRGHCADLGLGLRPGAFGCDTSAAAASTPPADCRMACVVRHVTSRGACAPGISIACGALLCRPADHCEGKSE